MRTTNGRLIGAVALLAGLTSTAVIADQPADPERATRALSDQDDRNADDATTPQGNNPAAQAEDSSKGATRQHQPVDNSSGEQTTSPTSEDQSSDPAIDPASNSRSEPNYGNDRAPRDGSGGTRKSWHSPHSARPDGRRNSPDGNRAGGLRGQKDFGLSFSTQNQGGGLSVSNVNQGSIGARAGLRQGDTIISIGGRPVRGAGDIYNYGYGGNRVPLVVVRDGRQQTIYFEPDWFGSHTSNAGAYLGVNLDQQVQDQAVVSGVNPGTPAEKAGLRRGDVIVSVDDQQITSPNHLTQVISEHKPGDEVRLDVGGGRQNPPISVVLAARGQPEAQHVYDQRPSTGYSAIPGNTTPPPDAVPDASSADSAPRIDNTYEPGTTTRQPAGGRRGMFRGRRGR